MHTPTSTHTQFLHKWSYNILYLCFFSKWKSWNSFHITVDTPHSWLITAQCQYSIIWRYYNFRSVQSLCHVHLFTTPWTEAHQASLSITNSQSSLKLTSIESVMPSNHHILCHPLLLPSIFPSIRVLSNESVLCIRWPKYWSFSSTII